MASGSRKADGPVVESSVELEDVVSRQLVCPISHRVMDLPVISPSGHTYDREPILEWLARRPVDPLSLVPLAVSSLCPNRAIHDEVVDQLEQVVRRAEDGELDPRFAAAARAKLESVTAAKATAPARAVACSEVGLLDRLVGRCACWASWIGLLAVEQGLVFMTSFGALLCLAIDVRGALRPRLLASIVGSSEARLVSLGEARAPPLLANFIRLAISPFTPPPKHWRWLGRLALGALRSAFLLPVGSLCSTLTVGSILSLGRFAQRCSEVRAVEQERAAQSQWFSRLLHACSVVTGLSSFGLFMQISWDRRSTGGAFSS